MLQTLIIALSALIAVLFGLGYYLKGDIGASDADFTDLVGETVVTVTNSRRRNEMQLRGLVWNVHYGHGAELDHFAKHSAVEVEGTLNGIAEVIKAADVDFVLLQEVDADADRSHNLDQLRHLAERSGFPYFAFIATWRARYIPFPYMEPARWLGKVHSGQGVLSRFPITSNRRILLPQPPENPFWYNWFYLNRAVQVVELAIPDEKPLQLFNVHLEAFSNANRMNQARLTKDLVWEQGRQDDRLLVAGDFNATPPEAPAKTGFPDEPETDFSQDDTVITLRSGMPTFDLLLRFRDKSKTFTFPASAPNRQLDHIFSGRAWARSFAWVDNSRLTTLSDHLPLRVVLTGSPSPRAGKRKPRRRAATTKKQGPGIAPQDSPSGLGVEILAPERLKRKAPIQGHPPAPPTKLNPTGWLEGAPEVHAEDD